MTNEMRNTLHQPCSIPTTGYFKVKDMNRAVEILPVIASFLVATLLITLSTIPQVKGSVVSKSPEMHQYHQTGLINKSTAMR